MQQALSCYQPPFQYWSLIIVQARVECLIHKYRFHMRAYYIHRQSAQDKYSFHKERSANGEELKGKRTNIGSAQAAKKKQREKEKETRVILLDAKNRTISYRLIRHEKTIYYYSYKKNILLFIISTNFFSHINTQQFRCYMHLFTNARQFCRQKNDIFRSIRALQWINRKKSTPILIPPSFHASPLAKTFLMNMNRAIGNLFQ